MKHHPHAAPKSFDMDTYKKPPIYLLSCCYNLQASMHIKYIGGLYHIGTLFRTKWKDRPQKVVKRIAKAVHFRCNNHTSYPSMNKKQKIGLKADDHAFVT